MPTLRASDLDVVVVGGGIAGLAAATALATDGVKVRVLEGRSRLGGRIHTSHLWSQPVDLGASWIHGARGNPLTELTRDFGIETAVTNYRKIVTYDVDGRPLGANGRAFWEEVEARLGALTAPDRGHIPTDPADTDASIYDILRRDLDPDLLDETHRRWWWAAAADWEHQYGADLELLDGKTGLLATGFDGPDRTFPGGYAELVDGLSADLDITLSCEVQGIHLKPGGVRLETSKGTLKAGQVIVTLPLGVLKSGRVVFEPALPERKLGAIDRLGSGRLDKCVLRFERCFWDEEAHFIVHVDHDRGRWSEFFNLTPSTGAPILIGLAGGAFSAEIESWPDGAVVGSAMDVLRGIYGSAVPDPKAWQITAWSRDPWSLGSYSFHGIGSGPEQRRILAEPVGNRLFFAGEATAERGYQTVHGALLSGLREADRILDLTRGSS